MSTCETSLHTGFTNPNSKDYIIIPNQFDLDDSEESDVTLTRPQTTPKSPSHPNTQTIWGRTTKTPWIGLQLPRLELVLEIHFSATHVNYVLNDKPEVAKAKPSWSRDNKAICGTILRTIHPTNIRNVRHLKQDARRLWDALKRAHQDSSAGGVMFWLQKLTLSRMVDDDLQSHLDDMAKTFERLSSFITADSPLTPEDIYSASILTSLPSDWLSCAKGLRRKTRSEETTLVELSSAAKTKLATSKPNSDPGGPPARHCTFCNVPGHNLNQCRNVARLISAHKSSQTPSTPATAYSNRNQSNGRRPPQPPAKATPLVPFGTAKDGESDFSGSELKVTAGQAAVSLSSTLAAIPSGDANLDSGCLVSMTPDLLSVVLAKTNQTPVRH
ncbi:uncharacterized protein PGTG_16412 [Puccinia graminis f. sp. tritici CRL 75-36-700-3]|uniref:Uncharacterized protein n=1 Tax=Puccinia graminis f. sp. tritici (strain CRL 75-36-700-3 / race SCCL) TaxID=418459 RepID=E3L3U6_PUCGT|nr:uncharacterized protein PGTG_16412 [Puccinia graminis f. sp. tritici CRL 75-36-700-3]EFP91221.2 hypothetical protein PGTG_16412 [Puccinia graminis f. sp. tritici CRL 75-36-700-3]